MQTNAPLYTLMHPYSFDSVWWDVYSEEAAVVRDAILKNLVNRIDQGFCCCLPTVNSALAIQATCNYRSFENQL